MKIPKVKMNKEELREYLEFKHRHAYVPTKKGKGTTYSRKTKHRNANDLEQENI